MRLKTYVYIYVTKFKDYDTCITQKEPYWFKMYNIRLFRQIIPVNMLNGKDYHGALKSVSRKKDGAIYRNS